MVRKHNSTGLRLNREEKQRGQDGTYNRRTLSEKKGMPSAYSRRNRLVKMAHRIGGPCPQRKAGPSAYSVIQTARGRVAWCALCRVLLARLPPCGCRSDRIRRFYFSISGSAGASPNRQTPRDEARDRPPGRQTGRRTDGQKQIDQTLGPPRPSGIPGPPRGPS